MSPRHSPHASASAHHTELDVRGRLERHLLRPLLSLSCVCFALLMLSSSATSRAHQGLRRAHSWLFDAARELPQLSAHLTPQERARDGLIRHELIWEPITQGAYPYTSHPYLPLPLKTLTLYELSGEETPKGRALKASNAGDQAWYEAYATRLPQWSAHGALWSVRELSRAELKRLNAPRSTRLMSNPKRPARLVTRVALPPLPPRPHALMFTLMFVSLMSALLLPWLLRWRCPVIGLKGGGAVAFTQALWVTGLSVAPMVSYEGQVNETLTGLAQRLHLTPLDLFDRSEGLWSALNQAWLPCLLLMWMGLWVGLWASPHHLKREANV